MNRKRRFDVTVAGGGPAGVTAALAAAREGAKTVLIEQLNCLGGVAATGVPIATFHTRDRQQVIRGYPQEIVDRLVAGGGSLGHVFSDNAHVGSMTPVYPEPLKHVCETMLGEEGVTILYHSRIAGVLKTGRSIEGVLVANKGGIEEISSGCAVDCTGDGDVMGFAGVPTHTGRSEDGLGQSMTLMFRVANVDTRTLAQHFKEHVYFSERPGESGPRQIHYGGSLSEWHEAFRERSPFRTDRPYLWAMCLRPGELVLNLTDVIGLDATSCDGLSAAEIEGRRQVFAMHDFLRSYVPGFGTSHVASAASHIGVRETRRLAGRYALTRQDILSSQHFEDAICRSAYCFDMHDPEGKGTFIEPIAPDASYEIPYGCLIADRWNGFICAGRCISTTHEAHAATRVMATCMATGQAAGTAAALAVSAGTAPSLLPTAALQKALIRGGVLLR